MTPERRRIETVLAQAETYRPAGTEQDGVTLTRGDKLTPEAIRWLWPGWLALGKLALLAGAPGTGKTTTALALAATITRGGYWPDGTQTEAGDVLIWSGEDDVADTLLPRLIAAGADRKRVFFVSNVVQDGQSRPFDPATDTAELLLAASKLPTLRFILVDPVVSAVAGDNHKSGDVRRGLQPLVDFATQVGASLVGITHFSKGTTGQDPLQRVAGSFAFAAVARLVLAAAKVKDPVTGNERRVLARSKSNIGPDDGGFVYELVQVEALPGITASKAVWGESLTGSARDLLAEPEPEQRKNERVSEAETFLREALAQGSTPAKTVAAEAEEAGIPWKVVQKAADSLSVIKRKGGMNDGWYWRLPTPLASKAEEVQP